MRRRTTLNAAADLSAPQPVRRRSTPIVIIAVSAALSLAALLAGCGTSASQPPATLPAAAGATTGTGSAPPLATLPADAPKFAIPADFHIVIDADSTGNATKDTVLLDAQYEFYGFVEALSTGDATAANFTTWTMGDAYSGLSKSVNAWKSRGERLTGTDHIFKRTVSLSSGGSQAVYSACEDSTQAYPLKTASGQRGTNTAGTGNFTLWQGTFIKRTSGTWALNLIFTKPGASQCVVS